MLVKSVLSQNLQHFFDPETMPGSDALGEWARAYASYGQMAMAGLTLPSTLVPMVVNAGNFFVSLDATFRKMWISVAWVGPGLTGVTTVVPPLAPILTSIGSQLILSKDPGLGLQLITEAIHTYTLSIVVTVATVSGPVPTPLT